ncbi:hypothetical protein [Rhizobium sp. 1399]|uniref:hypothetical protein n=1 Tax=Rhizobium sp. 1399 TaxID=2817758 RepID=UPI00285679AC|nr:hypothetical protein [Rhizobium sp. 1399]MDR6670184.1 hypothetical protein [Rhizobium sp. 1399]
MHNFLTRKCPDAGSDDPLLLLWTQWREAREDALELSRRQQELEAKLFPAVGRSDRATETADATARDIEHSQALEAEDRAFDTEATLAERLWETPAFTLVGTIAKLHAVLVRGQPSTTHDEYPWPPLRAVLTDLLKLDMGMSSGGDNLHPKTAAQSQRELRTG